MMNPRKAIFVLLSCVSAVAVTFVGGAAQVQQQVAVNTNSTTHVQVAPAASPGSDITWEIRDPVGHPFLASKDNRSIVFFTEGLSRIVVVCDVIDWDARKRDRVETVVTPGVAPGPVIPVPPAPAPRPDGFAGEVYDQAVPVRRPSEAIKLSDNYENVSAQIAAGGITTVEAANEEIARQNKALKLGPEWRPFGSWIGSQFDQKVDELPEAHDMMYETSVGLGAAGGRE
jgi:hypothetical protein